ncbi:LPP20 family lipoprotein [Alphaproteobacteria bacterium LSUCC0684]
MTKSNFKPLLMLPVVALLGACQVPVVLTDGKSLTNAPGAGMTDLELSQAESLKAVSEVLDAKAEAIPTLNAVGYAVVSSQPGRSEAQKRLMAIRAARMAAMRDLAEQIHGLKVDSSTTVIDLMVQNDTFRGIVTGTIRGARTVRINPTGADTYEIVLEIDREMIAYLMDSARQVI